jgi:dTDP-4-dehydrorhamnose 3,5-epimerase
MDEIKIEGIMLTPLKIIGGEKGSVLHAMKQDDEGFKGFGEAYFSTVNKGAVKGWKRHTRMTLNLVVPYGSIRFVVYDDRDNSTTRGKYFDVILSRENYKRLTVAPGLWMAFEGIGDSENILLNLASIKHDPAEAENCEIQSAKMKFPASRE